MGRKKNDGKGRLGGRAKGTPNKFTNDIKEWISNIIDNHKEQIEDDLQVIDAKDRLLILEKLLGYIVPKQQSVSIEAQLTAEYKELRLLLNDTPEEYIEQITQKIIELNNKKKEY